ncbi:MAG: DUF6418 domain-containing protein [bacterium]|nr:DUF6418 domain-containing protein [bacterium]
MGDILQRISLLTFPFVIAGSLLAILATAHPLSMWATAAFLLFCVYCIVLAKLSAVSFIVFSPILALRLTEMLSGASIEAGAYMDGSGAFGYPTGAFSRLLVVYIVFFSFGALVCEILSKSLLELKHPSREKTRMWWMVLTGIVGLSSLYLIYVGLSSGFPILTSEDRFQYLNKQSRAYVSIMQNRLLIVPMLGYLATLREYRFRAILLFIWINGISILFAEKFTSLLMMLTVFCMPIGIKTAASLGAIKIRWILLGGLGLSAVSIPTVLIVYGALDDFDGAIERYNERAAMQGEMWYLTDDPSLYWADTRWDVIEADASTWFKPSMQDSRAVGRDFGLYYVMAEHARPEILEAAMDYGGGFLFCLYPYLLMVSGLPGVLLISVVLASLHSLVIVLMLRCLQNGQWIAALLFMKSFNNILSAYIVGYLWFILGIKNLVFIGAAIGIMIIGERMELAKRTRLDSHNPAQGR